MQRASPSLNLWISLPICQLFGTIRGSICPSRGGNSPESHVPLLCTQFFPKSKTLGPFLGGFIQQATHHSHILFHWFCSTFVRNFLSLGKLVGNPSNHRTHCRLAKIHEFTRISQNVFNKTKINSRPVCHCTSCVFRKAKSTEEAVTHREGCPYNRGVLSISYAKI